MAQAYRVCAPYVTVRVTMAAGGETVLGFYEGGILPEAAVKENVAALLVKGMVEETDGPTPEESAAKDAKVTAAAREKSDKAAAEVAKANVEDAEKKQKAREAAAAKLLGEDPPAPEKKPAETKAGTTTSTFKSTEK